MRLSIYMIAFGILLILIWKWNYDRQTQKRIDIHQKEWDKIKQKLKENGLTEFEISDNYSEYIHRLWNTRNNVYGACFPHK